MIYCSHGLLISLVRRVSLRKLSYTVSYDFKTTLLGRKRREGSMTRQTRSDTKMSDAGKEGP